MRSLAFVVGLLVLVAGCSKPTEADRAELIGIWMPDDGSGRLVEFKADGVFDYRYGEGITLRLEWTLNRKGKVSLLSANAVTTACYYEVKDKKLTIDNGSGAECIRPGSTPPSPMPKRFTRA